MVSQRDVSFRIRVAVIAARLPRPCHAIHSRKASLLRSSPCSTPSDRRGRMSRLIAGLPERDQRRSAVLLETCPAIEMAMDGIRRADGMAEGSLLVVES